MADRTAADDFDEPFADGLPGMPPVSPKNAAMMENIIAILATASDQQIKEMRRTRPPDMPVEFFDALVAVARNKGGPPPFFDPKQGNFF